MQNVHISEQVLPKIFLDLSDFVKGNVATRMLESLIYFEIKALNWAKTSGVNIWLIHKVAIIMDRDSPHPGQ